jgi:hypothetical protein
MRYLTKLLPILAIAVAGCETHNITAGCCSDGPSALRVINGYTTPVDVLIDGHVAGSLAAGVIDTLSASLGAHTVALRQTGSGTTTSSQSITTAAGALNTIAVVRSSTGSVSSTVLDDTNSVVPAGATKLRVLHFAPNAGVIQVFRTQPDYGTPVSWQFPFTYQANPDPLSAPFFQSTVGTWEVRVWQTPADASGWSTAPVRITIEMTGGQKRTIVILDKPGGGIRAEVI